MAKATKSETGITNKLLNKIIAADTTKRSAVLSESDFFKDKKFVTTAIPAINIALSGEVDGGMSAGLLMVAGPSKHFKTLMLLISAAAYLNTYPDAIMVLYDSEFGSPIGYFNSLGIDINRVVHKPITDIEELKHDITNLLQSIEKGDKVFIAIDSIGNLASRKEADDAAEGKSVADMTRAKQLKSLFRIVTPYLTLKDIPMGVINHTYKTLEMYAKDVVGGGTGAYYSANDIWIIGRQQDKATSGEKELLGYNFIINIEKSRFVKEKSKIPLNVTFDGGLYKYSGLLDMAIDGGFIDNSTKGKYGLISEDGEVSDLVKEKDTAKWLAQLVEDDRFKTYVRDKYKLTTGSLIHDSSDVALGEDDE